MGRFSFAIKLLLVGHKTSLDTFVLKNLTLFDQPVQGFLHSSLNVLKVVSAVELKRRRLSPRFPACWREVRRFLARALFVDWGFVLLGLPAKDKRV